MKNYTLIGLIVGLVLALTTAIGGFPAFLWTIIFGVIGTGVGAQLDGKVDFPALLSGNRRSGRG